MNDCAARSPLLMFFVCTSACYNTTQHKRSSQRTTTTINISRRIPASTSSMMASCIQTTTHLPARWLLQYRVQPTPSVPRRVAPRRTTLCVLYLTFTTTCLNENLSFLPCVWWLITNFCSIYHTARPSPSDDESRSTMPWRSLTGLLFSVAVAADESMMVEATLCSVCSRLQHSTDQRQQRDEPLVCDTQEVTSAGGAACCHATVSLARNSRVSTLTFMLEHKLFAAGNHKMYSADTLQRKFHSTRRGVRFILKRSHNKRSCRSGYNNNNTSKLHIGVMNKLCLL